MDEVTGADGELIERWIALVDRESPNDEHWAFNVGFMAIANLGGGADFPIHKEEYTRPKAVTAVRRRLAAVMRAGLSEPFVIKALRREADDFFTGLLDTGRTDELVDRTRAHLRSLIEDPEARQRWRNTDARLSGESDEETIQKARDMLHDSPITRHVDADAATKRWAQVEEWRQVSGDLLPDVVFDSWMLKNIRGLT